MTGEYAPTPVTALAERAMTTIPAKLTTATPAATPTG